jgi:hypothetical protein
MATRVGIVPIRVTRPGPVFAAGSAMWRHFEILCISAQRLGRKHFAFTGMAAVAAAMLALQAPRPAAAFGWKDYPIPKLARPGLVPGGRTGATPRIWLPLAQYIHPFRGELVLKHKNWDGRTISSFAHSPKENRCEVTITRIGSGGVGPQAWMCAFISEVATCNGPPTSTATIAWPTAPTCRSATSGPMPGGCATSWTCRRSTGPPAEPESNRAADEATA